MDAGSVSMEAQVAIETLRKDSLATPVIQTDNGSAFISLEFLLVLMKIGIHTAGYIDLDPLPSDSFSL